jgi:hypothetical protein
LFLSGRSAPHKRLLKRDGKAQSVLATQLRRGPRMKHTAQSVGERNIQTFSPERAKEKIANYPVYNSSTTVQSSPSGAPAQKFETEMKISSSVGVFAATASRRSLS